MLSQPVGPATIQVNVCFSADPYRRMSCRCIDFAFSRCSAGRGETVGEYPAISIEVCKCSFLLDVGHHGRITHAEASVDSTTTPANREPVEKGVFVDYVLLLTQTVRDVLVGRAKAVVGLAAHINESATAPFYLEQARCSLVKPCVRDNNVPYPSMGVRLIELQRIRPRAHHSIRPEAIWICVGSSAPDRRRGHRCCRWPARYTLSPCPSRSIGTVVVRRTCRRNRSRTPACGVWRTGRRIIRCVVALCT